LEEDASDLARASGNDEISVGSFMGAGETGHPEGFPLAIPLPGKINPPASPGFVIPASHIKEKAGPVLAFDSHGRNGDADYAGLIAPGQTVLPGHDGGQFRFQFLEPVLCCTKRNALAPVLRVGKELGVASGSAHEVDEPTMRVFLRAVASPDVGWEAAPGREIWFLVSPRSHHRWDHYLDR
jgi:hypothetical protein